MVVLLMCNTLFQQYYGSHNSIPYNNIVNTLLKPNKLEQIKIFQFHNGTIKTLHG